MPLDEKRREPQCPACNPGGRCHRLAARTRGYQITACNTHLDTMARENELIQVECLSGNDLRHGPRTPLRERLEGSTYLKIF